MKMLEKPTRRVSSAVEQRFCNSRRGPVSAHIPTNHPPHPPRMAHLLECFSTGPYTYFTAPPAYNP